MRWVESLYACPEDLLFLILCVRLNEVIRLNVGDDEPQLLADHVLHAAMCPREFEHQLLPFQVPAARQDMCWRQIGVMGNLGERVISLERGKLKSPVTRVGSVVIDITGRN